MGTLIVVPNPDGSGNPIARSGLTSSTYTYAAVPSGSAVSMIGSYSVAAGTNLLNAMSSLVNGVNVGLASSDCQPYLNSLIADANNAISAGASSPNANTLKAAADSANRIVSELPVIGGVSARNGFSGFYLVLGPGLQSYVPLYDLDTLAAMAAGKALLQPSRLARMKLARAAARLAGMITSNLPGTSNGNQACAKVVEMALQAAYGQEIVGGTGSDTWVPDLTKGLIGAGWTPFDDPSQAQPGDIAVQNGRGDGGAPGDPGNYYENHVGIVVNDPNGSGLAILNNSSSRGVFNNYDHSLIFSGYYNAPYAGPPRFYRHP